MDTDSDQNTENAAQAETSASQNTPEVTASEEVQAKDEAAQAAEAPPDTPSDETPSIEAPSVEAPSAEAPSVEAPPSAETTPSTEAAGEPPPVEEPAPPTAPPSEMATETTESAEDQKDQGTGSAESAATEPPAAVEATEPLPAPETDKPADDSSTDTLNLDLSFKPEEPSLDSGFSSDDSGKGDSATPSGEDGAGDLLMDFNFVPQWAREEPKVRSDVKARDRDDRRDGRGGRDRGRRDGRRDGGNRDRRQGGGGGGGGRGRDNRRQGGGGGGGGGGQGRDNRRQGGGGGQGRRDGDRQSRGGGGGRRDQRGPRRPPPATMDLRVDFLPVRDRLNKVIEILRRSKRAFPLMEIAGRFAENEAFMLAKIQLTNDEKNAGKIFYICKSTGVPFLEQSECISHMLRTSLSEYFEEHAVEKDPPKGNFPCVGRCNMGGELLGPPNYHGYRETVEKLRRDKYPNMSPERFAKRIEQVHEPELVEEWRASQTKETVYIEKSEIKKLRDELKAAEKAAQKTEEKAGDNTEAPTPEAEEPTATESAAATETPTEPTESTEEPATEAAAPESDADSPAEVPEAETDSQTEPAEPAPAESKPEPKEPELDLSSLKKLTRNQAEVIFRDKYSEKMIKRGRKAIFPVPFRRELATSEIYHAVDRALRKEQRFPLTLSFALRPAFRHMKFHLFRADKSHVFVTAIQPTKLTEDNVIPEIKEILAYLEGKEGVTREILMSDLRPGVKPETPEASAIIGPLAWLVERGHVVQFFNGTLSIPKS